MWRAKESKVTATTTKTPATAKDTNEVSDTIALRDDVENVLFFSVCV